MRLTARSALALELVLVAPCFGTQQNRPPEFPEPPHQLLLVGTFHFRDAGLDSYRPEFDVDILSAERQAEVIQLVSQLMRFRPTKIAVEVMPERQAWLDSMYAAYRDGTYRLGSNEIYQLGFRLASAVGHRRLYAVDAKRRFYEPWIDPDSFAVAHGQQRLLDPDITGQYERLHRWEDEAKTHQSLREHLLYLNDPRRALQSHGQYLIDNFEVGTADEYPGVDSKTAWYNRNLRIFANLQRLVESEHERILLIIGAGHLALLQHAAQASPQFQFVELSNVLGADR